MTCVETMSVAPSFSVSEVAAGTKLFVRFS
jgi:hypothetical protein